MGTATRRDDLLSAWRGREAETRAEAGAREREELERGVGGGSVIASYALTVLEIGLGHYQAALPHALRVYQDDFYFGCFVLPEVVEAAARARRSRSRGRRAEPACPAGECQWHAVGPRPARPLASAHGRRRPGRGPVPGGRQPAECIDGPAGSGPRSPALRGVAAPTAAPRRGPRAAAHRAGHVRLDGAGRVHRPRPHRTRRPRRATQCARPGSGRRTTAQEPDRAGGADRPAGRGGSLQLRCRR